jgi:hypothetical protein
MLFDTVAEYDIEIAAARVAIKNSMVRQTTVSGGPAQGQHTQLGNVRDIKDYLELLSKEREIVLARAQGGNLNHVQFGRER